MHNFNLQISGTTGAGKTALIHYLLARTRRYVVFDPLEEYDAANAVRAYTFHDAAAYVMRHYSHPNMRLIFRGDSAALWENLGESDDRILREFRSFLRLFLYAMHFYKAPPCGLILEESHFYVMDGTRREPWPEIKQLYRFAGRRVAVSSINVVQAHTDIAPEVRQGAAVFVAMQNVNPPQSLQQEFEGSLGALKRLRYGERPENGVHYLTNPAGVDIVAQWLATKRGQHEKRASPIEPGIDTKPGGPDTDPPRASGPFPDLNANPGGIRQNVALESEAENPGGGEGAS